MSSVAEQAAEWLMRIEEDAYDPALQAQFEQWQAQDPAHVAAVRQMQELISQLEGLRGQSDVAHQAIKAGVSSTQRRKRFKQSANLLLVMGILALPLGMMLQHYPLHYWLSDLHTATAEWQSAQLPDRSQITLNGHTAVDVDFTDKERTIQLHQGEILIDVAKDATRPFVVKTEHGSITALGTRFVVSHHEHATEVTMLESKVKVQAQEQPSAISVVSQGESMAIMRHGVGALHIIDTASINDAWPLHQLVVQDQSLPEVLATISRHRKGYLRFDASALAQYQVTAVLPLDDTDRALDLLAESFPLRIKRFTPWMVTVQGIAATHSH